MRGHLAAMSTTIQECSSTRGYRPPKSQRVERRFGFFPPDLRTLLPPALPVSHGFVDWRSDGNEELRARLDSPAEGICFDVAHDDFWDT
jgi:hypothetical protein